LAIAFLPNKPQSTVMPVCALFVLDKRVGSLGMIDVVHVSFSFSRSETREGVSTGSISRIEKTSEISAARQVGTAGRHFVSSTTLQSPGYPVYCLNPQATVSVE
jgi:hypothetical protein